jgi:hypothetical protein
MFVSTRTVDQVDDLTADDSPGEQSKVHVRGCVYVVCHNGVEEADLRRLVNVLILQRSVMEEPGLVNQDIRMPLDQLLHRTLIAFILEAPDQVEVRRLTTVRHSAPL